MDVKPIAGQHRAIYNDKHRRNALQSFLVVPRRSRIRSARRHMTCTCDDFEDTRTDAEVEAMAEADRLWWQERPVLPNAGHWRQQPVSPRQKYTLEKAGLVVPATKGEASEAIDALMHQKKSDNDERYKAERHRREAAQRARAAGDYRRSRAGW